MAGALGWSPDTLRRASIAEVWACWAGHAKAQGWAEDEPTMSRSRLAELMEAYPDV